MSTSEHNEYDSSGFVSSTGVIGSYYDATNDRYRGLAPEFVSAPAGIVQHWQTFRAEAQANPTPASRLTLRMITALDVAQQAMQQVPVEAFVPITDQAGILYLAENADDRQSHQPIDHIRSAVDSTAAAISERFRLPLSRIENMHHRGYRFVDHVTDITELTELWGPTFRWNSTGIEDLEERLANNMTRKPGQRDIWFTGIRHNGHLVAAILAERLDVPGQIGNLPTIESTEWVVSKPYRRHGLASSMVAMNAAQCLNDCPEARILAECRISTEAYRAGMSVGYRVPPQYLGRQILSRNVWVEDELADFAVVSLPNDAIAASYSPDQRATMLNYLNREV